MSSKRMTANPVKPARYRPGKALTEDNSSDEEDESEEENVTQQPPAPPPKATSFPSHAAKVAANLKQVDLNERRNQAVVAEAARLEAEKVSKLAEEEGFVTEESEDEGESSGEGFGSEAESESEESSSSEDEAPKLLRPTFIRKDQRKETERTEDIKSSEEMWAEEEARRKAKADAMIQEQLEKDAAARAAGKKDWDDDEVVEVEQVDDTDGLDPETERAAWKLRELKRVKREREAIETAEREREEVERRRNLTQEEREAEDKEFLNEQKEVREGKGKMSYMQKYFHKGAFFQDDETAEALANRDIMGSQYADGVTNRELLPQYMQIRDMTKLGRKSRTKYKDLKTEDTGRWGLDTVRGPRRAGLDERFQPDMDNSKDRTGPNAAPLGEKRRPPEGAPQGPRADRHVEASDTQEYQRRGKGEENQKTRRRSYSRSRSPLRRRKRSFSRSPPRRRERRRSYSNSRSRSPRDRYTADGGRRKRSPSPYGDRYLSDKRRRVVV